MKKLTTILVLLVMGLAGPAEAHQFDVKIQWTIRTDRYIAKQEWKERVREQREARREAAAAAVVVESSPPPIPSYSGGVLSSAQVASYARGAGFPESLISTMVAIAWRESRFNPGAVNSSSGACGLWQMYPCPGPEALNPATNAAMAYAKYQAAGGLSPWGY